MAIIELVIAVEFFPELVYIQLMKKVSIVIPVFNEERTILETIQKVKNANTNGLGKEIIVVDDCSSDDTQKILQRIKGILVFRHRKNKGKGAAIRKGFREATGDIVIIQDADLEYDPSDYESLISPIISGHADVVYGSRFLNNKPHRVLYFWHSVANKMLTQFSNALTNLNLSDMETGYKVFSKEVAKKITPKLVSERFGIEPEITAKVAKLAKRGECRIYEVGISYFGRTYAEGKKINWRDGVIALWYVVKFNIFSK